MAAGCACRHERTHISSFDGEDNVELNVWGEFKPVHERCDDREIFRATIWCDSCYHQIGSYELVRVFDPIIPGWRRRVYK